MSNNPEPKTFKEYLQEAGYNEEETRKKWEKLRPQLRAFVTELNKNG